MVDCEEVVIIYQLNIPMKYAIFRIYMNEIAREGQAETGSTIFSSRH
jgi:hypothetical protein